ncbi:MAG: carbohydrate ABC transporter permease [Thermomicrobiales bacterium]
MQASQTLPPSRSSRIFTRDWLLPLALGALAFVFVTPFLLMVVSAFKTQAEVLHTPPTFLPVEPTLSGFVTLLRDAPYGLWYRNSMVVASAITATVLLTSSLAGYVFAKFDFPGKRPLFLLVLSTMMIPFPVLLIPSYLIVDRLELLNTLWALIVPAMVSAFGIFLMRQFIAGIPNDLIEAARIDGASEWAIYGRVIVPLVRPALAALGVFSFLASWNDYLWPLVVINDLDKSTVPLALAFFNNANSQRYDLIMAAATLAVVPVAVVFLIFQRLIVKALVLAGMR